MNWARLAAVMLMLVAGDATCADLPKLTPEAIAARMSRIDELVGAEMSRQKVPGVALAIVSHGKVVAAKGYGYSNLELQVPVIAATLFQSGSVGKQFTAAAIMLQVEDGKLALDDSITKYFTDAPRSWQPITVRHLLTHTSGMADYTEHGVDLRRDYTEDELAKLTYKLPLQFRPGERWSYSNTGYLLLGILVHKVSGQFFGDVLQERVFKPLGMNTARVISEADVIPNRAGGYRLENGELKNQEWVSPSLNRVGDGSLYLSILDYIAWDRGLRAGAILKPTSWKQVYTPVSLAGGKSFPYGFGWEVEESQGAPLYHHGGEWQGFCTYIARYLADDLTVVVLTNRAEAAPEHIVDGITGILDSGIAKVEHVKGRGE